MKILRYTCSVCAIVGILGIIGILVLSVFPFEERFYECILGLFTGLISGAFLAAATSFCELKIKTRRQKALLKSFCLELSVCLKQLVISFSIVRDKQINPKYFASNLNFMKGSGLQFANLICSEIDESLFIRKEKFKALSVLRGMAATIYSRTYVFDCQCKILTNKERIIDLEKQKSSVQFELIDVLTRELKLNSSDLINEIIFFGDENINRIEKAYEILFGEKDLKALCSELITIIDDFAPQIENIILESINGCGYE